MLREKTLFGDLNLVEKSIARLQEFEPPEGYWLAFSGGKDSICCHRLCELAGVKFKAHMSLTTVDPPELIYFVREHYPDVIWHKPKMNMWELIVFKKFPPIRQGRYCCQFLKETLGAGHTIITGVRWQESHARSNRPMFGAIKRRGERTFFLQPIIEWKHSDVWQFIHEQKMPYCKLYDEGHKRIGCIMCPLARKQKEDAARWPKYAAGYKRAICRAWNVRKETGMKCDWPSGEAMYEWWIGNDEGDPEDCSLPLFDN